jgi:hypothetical protein
MNMQPLEKTGGKLKSRPYTPLRDHPKYHELKRMIEELPSEKMQKLKTYIEKWLSDSGS